MSTFFNNYLSSGGQTSNLTGFNSGFQLPGLASGGGPMSPDLAGLGWDDLGLYGKLGVVGQGLGAFSSLANLYAGFKALNLQEDQFDFQKEAFNKNYANQVKDYENTLKDRWAARNASAQLNGRDFQSMGSYVQDRRLTGS